MREAPQALPCLFLVESFPEGEPLLEWCEHYQLEGIVSKRLSSRYSSGTCRDWQKTKCEGWRVTSDIAEGDRPEIVSIAAPRCDRNLLVRTKLPCSLGTSVQYLLSGALHTGYLLPASDFRAALVSSRASPT
jgi:hypothetical protein